MDYNFLKIVIVIIVIIIIYFVLNCMKNKKEDFTNQYTINDLQFNPNFQSLDTGEFSNKDIRYNYRNIKQIYSQINI